MKVLIIGSGGREHALAWKISSSPLLSRLFCAPGNSGTAEIADNLDVCFKDFEALKKVVLANEIDMVVVGPEDPLVCGLRDFFERDCDLSSVMFIGPGASGAMLEGSKNFAKDFMTRWNIPTARFRSFDNSSIDAGDSFLASLHPPYVLKADGLAGGKGVVILDDLAAAKEEMRAVLGGKFGNAGSKIVIEEYLSGIELSVFVLTDGKDYIIFPEAKDYKRIGDGDTRFNTGGMGAVSPVPFADKAFMKRVEERIIKPTVDGLQKDGIDYNGFIFIGLMNCGGDPFVIEYNVRLGDPETEAIMPRIESDLLAHLKASAEHRLASEKIIVSDKKAVTLVMVSGGYPEKFEKGFAISGVEDVDEGIVFHAGMAIRNNELVTNGGRVLACTVLGNDIGKIRNKIYDYAGRIVYKGKYYRKDIGSDLLNM